MVKLDTGSGERGDVATVTSAVTCSSTTSSVSLRSRSSTEAKEISPDKTIRCSSVSNPNSATRSSLWSTSLLDVLLTISVKSPVLFTSLFAKIAPT